MKRSAMKPRQKPMRRRSKKVAAAYEKEGGRRDFVRGLLRARPFCEARQIIMGATCDMFLEWSEALFAKASGWPRRASEVHEVLRRSAGGDILDPANCLCVSGVAHKWIHEHPKLARELGLLKSRYNR